MRRPPGDRDGDDEDAAAGPAAQGPAYAVSGFGKLPHVVFILDGQVPIMPEAESSSVKGGHLKTVVPVVPTPRSATSA